MTIITDISSMLPTKLQHVYDYIDNHNINNDSKISYAQFTNFLSELHLIPKHMNGTTQPMHLSVSHTNETHNSEFLHHIFLTYQQTSQTQQCNPGEYWHTLLSKPCNGYQTNTDTFIKAITDCNIPNTRARPRSGFSSKRSPRASLPKLRTKSDTKSMNNALQTDQATNTYEIDTDSDLDNEEFDILRKLPTWKKLKLSVYERRQRYRIRNKQKTILRIKAKHKKESEKLAMEHKSETIKNTVETVSRIQPKPSQKTEVITINAYTYSDLDFSSNDSDFDDIIKGPSPPPRKMMSAELKAMCGNLINELLSSPRSFYFRDYFPFEKWGLMDWRDYFSHNGLHLGIVKQTLESDTYETPGLFAADVRTIFNKATLYHWEGAKQYRIKAKAMLLLDEFEEKYSDILAEDEVSQKIRQELIQSMQQREEKRDFQRKISETPFEDSSCSEDYSDDEYSISTSTNLTHRNQSSVIISTDITMNSIPEQNKMNGDEISEMMRTLQQLTDVTDDITIKETNDYINNIRLDLMIAQKISRESPRLQKMRFLKQLFASQLLMEKKRRDIISYRTTKEQCNAVNSVRNTFFPDERYSYKGYPSRNSSIGSRGSQTFIRAHDLSIRYAINFPKSITIKAKSMSYTSNLSKTVSAESIPGLQEIDNEERESEFEELPMEMTDEKLIEEHTEDLWAAMPLVPVCILEKACVSEGKTWVESDSIVCNDINAAQRLLTDQYFAYTHSYVKTQFMTHFGRLRVGRDVFVGKLHQIFDTHKEFGWVRLSLPNYYVTPKSIIPMECVGGNAVNEKRNTLYGLLQILQPLSNGTNMTAAQIIYQHKLYLYELLKLSGVVCLTQESDSDNDTFDEFILNLDELWEMTTDDVSVSMDSNDSNDSLSDGESDVGLDVIGALNEDGHCEIEQKQSFLPMIQSKSAPGCTPIIHNTFTFLDEMKMMNDECVIENAEHLLINHEYIENVEIINSESDTCNEFILPPNTADNYAKQSAMNENYAGNGPNRDQTGDNNGNESNNNENTPNNNNQNSGNNAGGNGDDGDEKKNPDIPWNEIENKEEPIEHKEEPIDQDIDIVDVGDNHRFNSDNILKGLGVILVLIIGIIFGSDLIQTSTSEYDSETLHTLFSDAQHFLHMYDQELIKREKSGDMIIEFKDEIPSDHPSQTWINSLHIGSLVDALDVESKWYTGYVTNVDLKTNHIKIHYDDWDDRFDEWVDPQSGKLAPYRTRAIGGRFQGGLPGRPALPIGPLNDTDLSEFTKMKLLLWRQQKFIPDISAQIRDVKLKKYEEILGGVFYEIGKVYSDRAVYMNRYGIFVYYRTGQWCVSHVSYMSESEMNAIVCVVSEALRPELMETNAKGITFIKHTFAPAYLAKKRKKKYTPIGNKGLKSIPTVTLNNKVMMPQVIVGTEGIHSADSEIIYSAAKLGYYMYDTGMHYYNHRYINDLFKVYGRSTIGVSTKMGSRTRGYQSAIQNLITQLDTLDTDYFDLVIMEYPNTCASDNINCDQIWIEAWRALEYMYDKKRVRALGVSGFSVTDLAILIQNKQKHIPLSIVREWRDPLHSNAAVLQWCNKNNIIFEAYSALGGQYLRENGGIINPVLSHPTIQRIADKNGMETAQVVIKWNIQRGVGVVLKTTDLEHLSDNLDTFSFDKLTEKELHEIDLLGYKNAQTTKKVNLNKKQKQEPKQRPRSRNILNPAPEEPGIDL